MTSPTFPEPNTQIPATSHADLDAKLQRLADHRAKWIATSIPRRIEYLQAAIAGVLEVSDEWIAAGCRMKGLAADSVMAGEEWLAGPMTTIRNIRLLIDALKADGRPKPPSIEERQGRTIAHVFPGNLQDKLMFSGFKAEVWMKPGQPASQGAIYRGEKHEAKVALVLGAGNVSSIPPMDALYKLFAEDEVVLVKMNPVNEWVGPLLARAFRSLAADGFFDVCYGGAEVGAYLADHALVETLHVTGSDRTYDAIVWGTGDEQKRRKEANDPKNKRHFTAELGCVTPVIVVPGEWTESELDFQARHVAAMVTQNASFNCNAAKVIVTAKGWPQRESFLKKVRTRLGQSAKRKAYYPGAEQRYRAFIEHYPQAEVVGEKGDGVVPWTFIPNVADKAGEYALTNEAFCGVLADCAIGDEHDANAATFLREVTTFANERCWGTLSCVVLIDPRTEKREHEAFEHMIGELRYGGIGVNVWPGVIYGLVVTTWGAFPGHDPRDIQSGEGVVHNSYLFDHAEKSVVRAPFKISPTPPWFSDHRNLRDLGAKLAKMESAPSWGKLVGVAMAAFKG